ncbi:MAG: FAD-binding oxidoreductase [Alphaproteobacteria bacterium]|nr:MAG: FAD-binding oxidoreductase [Alphaproteobacteria bacterium]
MVIIGGGAIGSAAAAYLATDPGFVGTITVVERDPTYARASSALSASSIRQQFSTPENIALSQAGLAVLRDPSWLAVDGEVPSFGLVEGGYLFLATEAGLPVLEANHRVQRQAGAPVALLTPSALTERFAWMMSDGVAAASLGLSGEGWFDGYALMQAFRRKARSLGVRYCADEAVGFERAGPRITAVRLASGEVLAADQVVNAAGPWAAAVAAMAGIDVPVRARARSVFVLHIKEALPGCPLVIDTSGVWFRPEGHQFLCGWSPPETDDPDDAPLEVRHDQFEEVIWPALATRVRAFEAVKVTNSWAGYYEMNTHDHNALLGRHPACDNLWFANGFSGHGIQQAPAVGRDLAERLIHGHSRSLDLSVFDIARVIDGRRVVERNVI